jgi:ammonium transporter Rh
MPTESTPLVASFAENGVSAAKASAGTLSFMLGSIQLVLTILFLTMTTYDFAEYSPAEYVIFRDIMVMLLLGFGFLMTFLKQYGLGAVGLTMMLSVMAVQLNIFVEFGARLLYGEERALLPLPLSVASIIDGEFSAATLLISYGAVIGRASPVQLVIMALFQSFFYAGNKVLLVLGMFGAEDVGGTITIHMFGAYFGLAASYALGAPKPSASFAAPSQVSDIFALIGTTLLWVYWPSFVGATETGVPANERMCVMHTIFALLGSTGATFFMSLHLSHDGKLDPVHIANSTLAGGVAVGSSARLAMTPGGSMVVGVLAGVVSVLGYVHSTPMLESKLGLYDTCGVGNLHGWPSILGGLASVVFVMMDPEAEFLVGSNQGMRQLMAVGGTLVIAVGSGYLTGTIMKKSATTEAPDEYDDSVWWEGEYFEHDKHEA